MTIEEVKELGWKFDDYWNNRALYSLSKISKFSIFEHNGYWGLQDPYKRDLSLIYCDMSLDDIKKFTDLVKLFEDMFAKPKEYTLFQYLETESNMQEFIKQMKEKE